MVFVNTSGFEDLSLLGLRLILGYIFLRGGFRKTKNPQNMAKTTNWPIWKARTLGIFEFIGGLGILLGLYIQAATLIPIVVMFGALYYKLFVWKNHDIEFDLLILLASIVLFVLSAGSISLDAILG